MNTGDADFWNGKEEAQSEPQFSSGLGLVDLFLFSKVLHETHYQVIMMKIDGRLFRL